MHIISNYPKYPPTDVNYLPPKYLLRFFFFFPHRALLTNILPPILIFLQLNFEGSNLFIHAVPINSSFAGTSYSLNSTGSGDVSFHLPSLKTKGDAAVVFTTYTESSLFPTSSGSSSSSSSSGPVSDIIDVTVVGGNTSYLNPPAQFSLSTNANGQVRCVYYDTSSNTWLGSGVSTLSYDGKTVQCTTSHLTNFAVLLVGGQ